MVSTETHWQQNSVYEFGAYLLGNPLEHLQYRTTILSLQKSGRQRSTIYKEIWRGDALFCEPSRQMHSLNYRAEDSWEEWQEWGCRSKSSFAIFLCIDLRLEILPAFSLFKGRIVLLYAGTRRQSYKFRMDYFLVQTIYHEFKVLPNIWSLYCLCDRWTL